jgi:hypothetical protein
MLDKPSTRGYDPASAQQQRTSHWNSGPQDGLNVVYHWRLGKAQGGSATHVHFNQSTLMLQKVISIACSSCMVPRSGGAALVKSPT